MSNTPPLVLKAMDKSTGYKSGKIGAGWLNADGSISVVLDVGVSISYNTNVMYMLFPNDRPAPDDPTKKTLAKKKAKTVPPFPSAVDGPDIPF